MYCLEINNNESKDIMMQGMTDLKEVLLSEAGAFFFIFLSYNFGLCMQIGFSKGVRKEVPIKLLSASRTR